MEETCTFVKSMLSGVSKGTTLGPVLAASQNYATHRARIIGTLAVIQICVAGRR